MYGSNPLSGPGDGFFPPAIQHIKIRNATAATAFVQGSVVMLDLSQSRAAGLPGSTYSIIPGHATTGTDDSVFNNCILPTSAGIGAGYPIFVCEEAIAAGAVGKATLMGPNVQARVAVAGGDTAAGAILAPANNVDFLSSTASTVSATNFTWFPAQAWLLNSAASTTATGSSVALLSVWLNGRGIG